MGEVRERGEGGREENNNKEQKTTKRSGLFVPTLYRRVNFPSSIKPGNVVVAIVDSSILLY